MKFSDLILNYKPEPTKKIINVRTNHVKNEARRMYSRLNNRFYSNRNRRLETVYRMDEQEGCSLKTFITNIKSKLIDLIRKENKSIHVNFFFRLKL